MRFLLGIFCSSSNLPDDDLTEEPDLARATRIERYRAVLAAIAADGTQPSISSHDLPDGVREAIEARKKV